MNLKEILSNDLVKRLENEAENLGIDVANQFLYEQDELSIEMLEKARYSASDIETYYFFSALVEKELEEIFEKYNEEDDSFYDFLNEICYQFDLYRISETAFHEQNNKNIEELKKDI